LARQGRSLSLRGVVILCLLSGVLLSLAFPPVGAWPLAWIALVPWIACLRGSSRGGAFLGSWLGGAAFFGLLVSWLHLFGFSVWLVVTLLLGFELAVWGLVVRRLGAARPVTRVLGTAVLWCGVEWARGLGAYGFTWGWLGYSQSPALALLPLARYLGTLGLSFSIVLVNTSLAEIVSAIFRRGSVGAAVGRAVLGGSLAAALVGGAGLVRPSGPPPEATVVRAAVVQGNEHGPLTVTDVNRPLSPEERERTLHAYESLTAEAARRRPVLVVWPESVLPAVPEDDPAVAARVGAAARENNVWLLAGGPGSDAAGQITNSAYLYSPIGLQVARYDKVQLVPFGEYVPRRARLPFLNRYNVREFDFVAGAVPRVLQAGTVALGPSICFESTFPTLGWDLTRRGAQVLVVITNDAWFGKTAAAAQHRQIAVLRAVENGRWVLRAASTGISSIIAPEGRIVSQAGLYQPAILTADVQLISRPAPSVRLGPAFGWTMAGLSLVILCAPLVVRGKGRRRPERPPKVRPTARAGRRR